MGPKAPWGVREVALALLLLAAGAVVAGALGGAIAGGGEPRGARLTWALGLALGLELLLLALVWWLALRRPGGRLALGLQRGQYWAWWLVPPALGLAVALVAGYGVVVRALGIELLRPPPPPPLLTDTIVNRALGVLLAVAIAPVAEESFFRGFILGGLRGRVGLWAAAGLSAALFALSHAQLGALVPIFALGLLLAGLYVQTRAIWPAMLVHAGYNGVALLGTSVVSP